MRLPIEVHNKLIPFKGFSWVTWLLWSFTRKPMAWSMDETTRRHEVPVNGGCILIHKLF